MPAQDKRVPQAIRRRADGLEVAWNEAAGDVQLLPYRALRLACPCAGCVDEMSGRRLLDPASVAGDIAIVSLALVGAYGLRIRWTDGHGTGIYTFPQLRALGG